jgi:hypothetical protein
MYFCKSIAILKNHQPWHKCKGSISNKYGSYPTSPGIAIDIDDEDHYIGNMRDCSVRMESVLLDVNEK